MAAKATKNPAKSGTGKGKGTVAEKAERLRAAPKEGTPPVVRPTCGYDKIPPTRFLLLGGSYTDPAGAQWEFNKEEDTVVVAELPLDEMYPNQWQRIDGSPAKAVPGSNVKSLDQEEADEEAVAEAEAEGEEGEEAESADLGDDVTSEFSSADEAGVKVYRKGHGASTAYSVVDADMPTAVLNKKSLTNKTDVEAFIEKQKPGG